MRDLDLKTLRCFIAVVQEKSITAASARMNYAASAISKRLAELETQVGQALFQRSATGMLPTAAGKLLFDRASHLLAQSDALRTDMGSLAKGDAGDLYVFAVSAALSGPLPEHLAAFEHAFPQVKLRLAEGINAEVFAAVDDRRADVGIAVKHALPKGLEIDDYADDPIWVITAKGHPLTSASKPNQALRFSDVIAHDLISLAGGASIEALVASAASLLERPVRKHFEVSRYDSLRRLVEAGLGVGFIRRSGIERYMGVLALDARPLAEPWATTPLCIVNRPGAESSQTAKVFARFLVEQVRKKTLNAAEGETA